MKWLQQNKATYSRRLSHSGQPSESLEASFDIIQDTSNAKPELLEAEAIFSLCRVMGLLKQDARTVEVARVVLKSPVWFLRLSHTRLSDGKAALSVKSSSIYV